MNDGTSESHSTDYDSTSESDDSEANLLTPKMDLQVIRTISALRNKDDAIYDKEKKFFQMEQVDGVVTKRRSKGDTKITYKKMIRDEILGDIKNSENVTNRIDENNYLSDDINYISASRKENKLTKLMYDNEQKALRAEFLKEEVGKSNEEDWIVKKKDSSINDTVIIDKEQNAGVHSTDKSTHAVGLHLTEEKDKINGDEFLLDFITNKRWDEHVEMAKTEKSTNASGYDSDTSLIDLNRTDEFESKYNFRFEETNSNSGAPFSVTNYNRSALPDSIRKSDDSRRMKRRQTKERKLAERKMKEERLRRLKNIKKQELDKRITKIKSILGEQDCVGEMDGKIFDEETMAQLMQGDFDPDKFETLMSKIYCDEFYEREDSEWKTDLDVVPDTQKEALECNIGDNILSQEDLDESLHVGKDHNNIEFDNIPEGEAEKEMHDYGVENELHQYKLDELYKLDYEDIIGNMPTRFKYRKVEANRYGLTPHEILLANDTSLRQYVSLKKMVPYADEAEFEPDLKKKKKFKKMLETDIKDLNVKRSSETETDSCTQVTKKKRRRRRKRTTEEVPCDGDPSISGCDVKNDKITETSKKNSRSKRGKKEKKSKEANNLLVKEDQSNVSKIDKKTYKSKKHKRKQEVEGLTSSRLASYGL